MVQQTVGKTHKHSHALETFVASAWFTQVCLHHTGCHTQVRGTVCVCDLCLLHVWVHCYGKIYVVNAQNTTRVKLEVDGTILWQT